jgi:hypothetical protein
MMENWKSDCQSHVSTRDQTLGIVISYRGHSRNIGFGATLAINEILIVQKYNAAVSSLQVQDTITP